MAAEDTTDAESMDLDEAIDTLGPDWFRKVWSTSKPSETFVDLVEQAHDRIKELHRCQKAMTEVARTMRAGEMFQMLRLVNERLPDDQQLDPHRFGVVHGSNED